MARDHQPPAIDLLEPERSGDAGLVARLVDLVNGVYAVAESGLWHDAARRTTASELAELIEAREIVVATQDAQIVGMLRLHDLSDDTSELGLLVADPDHRGSGVGRALLDFAERRSRERGLRAMRLELLVPREWSHPSKEFLRDWYGRRGYRLVRVGDMRNAYPQVAPLLATACDLEVREKPLQQDSRAPRRHSVL